MAKKNKNKATSERPSTSAAVEGRTASGAKSNVEEAFVSGNYAAVRAFAKSDPGAATQKLLALTKIDMVPVAVGLFALAVVLTVALMTLH